MADAAFAIGTEGLQGAVTTPAEADAINIFAKARAAYRETAPKPTLAGMIAAIDDELAAREAGARVQIQVCGAVSDSALDRIATLDAAIELLRRIEPHRKAVWKLVKPAADGKSA